MSSSRLFFRSSQSPFLFPKHLLLRRLKSENPTLASYPEEKEADGIVGDFVLRNDRIEAVISGNLHLRRPNMGGFYGDGNHTPGTLYDLTKRGEHNDQITIFVPCGQKGPVNYVKILDNGSENGRAVIETMVSSAKSGGLYKSHRYILEDGWDGVLVVTTIRNESNQKQIMAVWDGWTQMREKGRVRNIDWADAIDPADKCGYAFGWVKEAGAVEIPSDKNRDFNVGDQVTLARFLAVGTSPAEAIGHVAARRDGDGGTLKATISGEGGSATRARLMINFEGEKKGIPAYPNSDGELEIKLPAGNYTVSAEDIGRTSVKKEFAISEDQVTELDFALSKQSAVSLSVKDEKGTSIPCKVQFNPIGDTPKPNLGPTDRAHGCVDQWHSAVGDFRVPLPAGSYEVVITRGPEFSHHREEMTLSAGEEKAISATLERQVDTSGWISADYHNHSTPSGDNTCGTNDRLINLAAEHIEFAPTTEHNRLYDWEPHISELGLTPFLKTIPGMELTGRGASLQLFPPETGSHSPGWRGRLFGKRTLVSMPSRSGIGRAKSQTAGFT